jgi:hypothetical protein
VYSNGGACCFVYNIGMLTGLHHVDDKAKSGKDEVPYGGTEDSGGKLNSLQARFDVQHVELDLEILPSHPNQSRVVLTLKLTGR